MRSRFSTLDDTTALSYWAGPRTGIIEGIILTALTSAGVTGAALGVGTAILTGIAGVALSTGLSFLAQSLFRPSAPRPEDVQQSFRQATAPRVRHYGRVKASGPLVFLESSQGDLYKIIAIGQGLLDAIEQFWIDDNLVTTNEASFVTTAPYNQKVAIQSRLGASAQSAYSFITSRFPEWTSAHRGDGVSSIAIRQLPVPDSDFLGMFPNGINTNYRVVLRGARVQSPVTATVSWSDNAASIIRDYLTHRDGMRLPTSIVGTPLARAGWVSAFNRAAQAIPRAAGGTEPRYRLWGSYQLNERPADVLGRMLQSCDARLVPTPDGGLTLDIGTWVEPTVVLGPEAITGFSEVGRGRDVLTTANTIRATYLEPSQDYQAADADPWADEDDVSERGEIASDLQFHMSPSHGQARRLMKLAYYRANPTWVGTFQMNLRALAAIGERFVRIQYPLFGINSVFEVQDFRFNLGEGGILTGVTLQVQSMPSASYQWDASQEGTAPVMEESEGSDAIPVPLAPTVDLLTSPARARLSFSPSPSPILFYQARYREDGGDWFVTDDLSNDASSITLGPLEDATEYDFALRLVTEKGRPGEWGPASTITTP